MYGNRMGGYGSMGPPSSNDMGRGGGYGQGGGDRGGTGPDYSYRRSSQSHYGGGGGGGDLGPSNRGGGMGAPGPLSGMPSHQQHAAPVAEPPQKVEYKSLCSLVKSGQGDILGRTKALSWNERGDRVAHCGDASVRIFSPDSPTEVLDKTYKPQVEGHTFVGMEWDPQRHPMLYCITEGKQGGYAGVLQQIDTRTSKSTETKIPDGKPVSIACSPDGNLIAVHAYTRNDDRLFVFDVRKKMASPVSHTFKGSNKISSVQWVSNRSVLYATDETVEFIHVPSFEMSQPFRCHRDLRLVVQSRDRGMMATMGNDALISFWDTSVMAVRASVYQHNFPATHVALSATGQLAAYSIDDTGLTHSVTPPKEILGRMEISDQRWWAQHIEQLEARRLEGPIVEVCRTDTAAVVKTLRLASPFKPNPARSVQASIAERLAWSPAGNVLAFALQPAPLAGQGGVRHFGPCEKDIGIITVTDLEAEA